MIIYIMLNIKLTTIQNVYLSLPTHLLTGSYLQLSTSFLWLSMNHAFRKNTIELPLAPPLCTTTGSGARLFQRIT